ncbi:glycoside hydrolase domain-containing protein [Streptomyces sp. NPDC096094]|uniref:glycoside hydrolase domain-containing protein n=1 Tax=Streptomyces sp. NPDC096094 TaxID=3366073 RepID=UPI00381B32A6
MSDPNIRAVQDWVNATYANAPGYVPCTPNGRTGWETVDCLTQALQYELGISPTVKNFGPGTLAAVQKRYRFPAGETNENIVRIYNAALWCKGYYGSEDPAVWDARAQVSLSSAVSDLGLIFDSVNIDANLWARVTRSLLRMDQFLMVPGGKPTTKRIQQFLNRWYVQEERIPAMNLVPSDGIYSRDVQQGLMLAIQFELGLDKNTINGNFGDGTKAALKSKGTGIRLTPELERLFRAACWFNSPTWDGNGNAVHYDGENVFSDDAWTATGLWVNAFQEFSQLPTGTLDDDTFNYKTWAQLLVSCGDETREGHGCDTAAYTSPERARALWAADYRIIGRYLDEHLEPDDPYYLGKALKPGEAAGIVVNAMRLFPLFQYNGTQLANFTETKGYDQGLKADAKAREHGIPHGSCIYFAVDYDAQDEHITSHVVPYFHGVRNALARSGARYVFGVYGTRNVCERVSREAGARWSFVSGMSWGYSGNLGFPMPHNWSLNQIREYQFQEGYGLDHNVWRLNSDRGVSFLATTDERDDDLRQYIEFVKRVESVISGMGYPRHDVIDATLAFLRSAEPNYHDWKWSLLLGGISGDVAAECAGNGIEPGDRTSYYDPLVNHRITLAHFGAAAEGAYNFPGSGTEPTTGEGCGWAGDILNAYTQWRENHRDLSGHDFCVQVVGSATVESRFGSDNLVADVDAHNIAVLLRGSNGELGGDDDMLLSDALEAYHFGDGLNQAKRRFTAFYYDRFRGSSSTFKTTVRKMLTLDFFSAYDWAKKKFLPADEAQWPANIPADALDSFIDGMFAVINRRTEGEGVA